MSMPRLARLATAKSIGADDVARVAGAVLVEHFQHDELHVRRQAAVVSLDDSAPEPAIVPGDVRAVPVVVERRRGDDAAVGEVVERLHAALELGRHLEARVDHGDRDALARPRVLQAERRAQHRRRHRLAARVVERRVEHVAERVQQAVDGARQDLGDPAGRRAGRRAGGRRRRRRCRATLLDFASASSASAGTITLSVSSSSKSASVVGISADADGPAARRPARRAAGWGHPDPDEDRRAERQHRRLRRSPAVESRLRPPCRPRFRSPRCARPRVRWSAAMAGLRGPRLGTRPAGVDFGQ